MDFSWNSFSTPDPGSELLGVIGEIRPFRYRSVPRIMQSTRRIESQLADSEGLVGYSLRAEFFHRRFWAVSVWDGAESLGSFVETAPHAEIKAALKPEMETSRFITFDVTDDDIPLSVDAAKAIIG
jgi:hypothetical protein